jgi:hypothetical protein
MEVVQMNKNYRSRHVPKSAGAREFYLREIKNRDYEPTVKEKEPFDSSDSTGEYDHTPVPTGKRPIPKGDLIGEHFRKNWTAWVLSGIGAVVLFFAFTFSKAQGNIEGVMSETHKTVDKIEDKIEKISEKTSTIEIETIKNSGRIDVLNTKIYTLENINNVSNK